MLGLRAFDRFTLDWSWAVLYFVGVCLYALIVSKALTIRLKSVELALPGAKFTGDANTSTDSQQSPLE